MATAVLDGGKTLAVLASQRGVHGQAMDNALRCPPPAILLRLSFFNSGKIKTISAILASGYSAQGVGTAVCSGGNQFQKRCQNIKRGWVCHRRLAEGFLTVGTHSPPIMPRAKPDIVGRGLENENSSAICSG